ncbi:MAG: hypothetical protein WCO25_00160 [Candidatus Uhrbacteria bacterium]
MMNAIAALMLITMMPGQAVVTETTPIQAPAAIVQTIADSVSSLSEDPSLGPDVPVTPPVPTVQEALLSVCEAKGYGEDCAKTLLGMLWIESNNISTAVGDHGLARGYFQIHYKMHKITTTCAEDIVCSATWTVNYLEAHGYPDFVKYAVQCHNSCNAGNGYAAKAIRNGKRLWETPLAIAQADPVLLAMN